MSISLQKGGNINLSKTAPGLKRVRVGLGWDARATDGADFDLDASAFMVKADEKVPSSEYFVFYNQLRSPEGSVVHAGDNRTGEGEGDDETIEVRLDDVPPEIAKIVFVVTIHEADARGQNFGQVSNAYIRCVNEETGEELARYDLSEDSSTETAMIFGEIYRHGGDWKFRAVGQGYAGGLKELVKRFGIPVD